jgi:hypothetical protein
MRLLYVEAKMKENIELKYDHDNKHKGYKLCCMREKEMFFFSCIVKFGRIAQLPCIPLDCG